MILVLTSGNDRTADRIVAELGRRGEAVNRFDVADFPRRLTVNAELQDEFGWRGWVRTEDGQIPLDQVKSIYYRRPTSFIFPDDVVGSDLAFAAAEARIECNANGQFGWLEAETGLPITAAMADLLIGVTA